MQMRSWAARAAILFAGLAVAACHDQAPGSATPPADPDPIATNSIMVPLSQLADDSMRGRGSGTADEVRASLQIKSRFQSALTGTFTQAFLIPPRGGTEPGNSQNIAGVIEGRGALKDEWIVIGAHYDHVGVRTVNGTSAIYNGADDNASGTAAVLALAASLGQYFNSVKAGTEPHRSILFITFGAEELGLVGSQYFCSKPTMPFTSIYAMINFDMVGHMQNNTVTVGGMLRTAEFEQIVSQYNSGLTLQNATCSGTDCYCFANAGRPYLWFFTGLHPDYHQPSDDIGLVNTAGLTAITNLAQKIIVHLAFRSGALHSLP